MKKLTLCLVLLICLIVSCQKTMSPWNDGDDKKEDVVLSVKSSSFAVGSATIFFIDKSDGGVTMSTPSRNGSGEYDIRLYVGEYDGYFIGNAVDDEAWSYSDDSKAKDIDYTPVGVPQDIVMGKLVNISVADNGTNVGNFTLARKVAKLRVIIKGIPASLTDLTINISGVTKNINLLGETSTSTTVSMSCATRDASGTSTTEFLVLPPKEEDDASIYLSSDALDVISESYPIRSIKTNYITVVNIDLSESPNLDSFTASSQGTIEWASGELGGNDIDTDIPFTPCTGNASGANLVANNSFEERVPNANDEVPAYAWKYSGSASVNAASLVTGHSKTGSYALALDGSTNVYQDVTVLGGQCYALSLYVNAPTEDAKWRWVGTWYKGSKAISSKNIESEDYQGVTEGYMDIYEGSTFRAPVGATKLRLELRNYSGSTTIYMDDVSVKLVE